MCTREVGSDAGLVACSLVLMEDSKVCCTARADLSAALHPRRALWLTRFDAARCSSPTPSDYSSSSSASVAARAEILEALAERTFEDALEARATHARDGWFTFSS